MPNSAFPVPLGPARAEIVVVNSRFIASLDYVESARDARAFIARIRDEFPDATHNVPAFIAGGGASRLEFCSDDGEPSGTSGRPLLAVLRGSGLGDVAVVVTRYFGGTLLGTGGLVKAYSEAGRRVIALAARAELAELSAVRLEIPYQLFDAFRQGLPGFGGSVAKEDFAETVRLEAELPSDEVVRFRSWLADLSSGGAGFEVLGSRMARRPLPGNAAPSR
ncbi:YigZ family protein [bacterium]|nr:YigZ family protein [bacterium]